MFESVSNERQIEMVLYTDAYRVRGQHRTRLPRLTDVLNHADEPFIILEQVIIEEYGSRGDVVRSDFAQVNLGAVLFGVSDVEVPPTPELRVPKVSEEALITVPPFKITGRIHLLPEREFRVALSELTGRFVPVTEATYWSDSVASSRETATVLSFNHDRAQILAPHKVVDPWAGLDVTAGQGGGEPSADSSPA